MKKALNGRRINIPTIIIGKIEMEFPAMYMMNRFIGNCFSGPRATSQLLCIWKDGVNYLIVVVNKRKMVITFVIKEASADLWTST